MYLPTLSIDVSYSGGIVVTTGWTACGVGHMRGFAGAVVSVLSWLVVVVLVGSGGGGVGFS